MNNIELLQGNCIDKIKGVEDSSIDLILTDPPYNIGEFAKSRNANIGNMRDNFFVDAGWDNIDANEWELNMWELFAELPRVLKVGASVVMFMSFLKIPKIIDMAVSNGLYYKTTGIWHKTNPIPMNMNLHFISSVEPWIYFTYGAKTGTYNNNGIATHNYIETSVTSRSERKFGKHPTQKPVDLMKFFVEYLTNPNDMVLDPFMGSGSAGVACVNANRGFVGIELDKNYYNIAKERIEKEYGATKTNQLELL